MADAEDTLPSFAERRALFGQAHDAVIPEQREREAKAPSGLQEFLDLWSAILEAQSNPNPNESAGSLAGALHVANSLGSEHDFRGRSELLAVAGDLLAQLESGKALDEANSGAQMESLAAFLGADFLFALRLHMQFQREAREEAAARATAQAEAEAATAAFLNAETSDLLAQQSARQVAEQEGAAAALALHAVDEADEAAERLRRARLKEDARAATALAEAEREALIVKGWLLKAGEKNTAYQRRYCVLAQRELAWCVRSLHPTPAAKRSLFIESAAAASALYRYASQEAHDSGSQPKGFVRVAGADIVDSNATGFRFSISPPKAATEALPPLVLAPGLERVGRRLLLEADDQTHMNAWVEALRQAAEMVSSVSGE